MTTISFSEKAVPVLALFAAKNDIRYYLDGLCVEPAPHGPGCVIVATDGHQMALWYDEDGVCDKRTILSISKKMIGACEAKDAVKIRLHDGTLSVDGINSAPIFVHPGEPIIDAKYPIFWRVIPKTEDLVSGMHGSIAARLMRKIGKAGSLIAKRECAPVAARHYSAGTDGNGSILSRFEWAKNFMVITMPVRSDYLHEEPIPPCFKPPIRPSAEATANFPTGSMGEEVHPA